MREAAICTCFWCHGLRTRGESHARRGPQQGRRVLTALSSESTVSSTALTTVKHLAAPPPPHAPAARLEAQRLQLLRGLLRGAARARVRLGHLEQQRRDLRAERAEAPMLGCSQWCAKPLGAFW